MKKNTKNNADAGGRVISGTESRGRKQKQRASRRSEIPGTRRSAGVRGLPHGHAHGDRADLAAEHPLGDAGQLLLGLIFMIVWVLDSFFLHWTVIFRQYIPWYVSAAAGGIIGAAAVYLALNAHRIVFAEVRETPAVIEKGVFRLVRHPMYLGSILLFLALTVASLSLASLAVLSSICLFYNHIAAYEEVMLEQKYGKPYLQYKARVARWVPGLK